MNKNTELGQDGLENETFKNERAVEGGGTTTQKLVLPFNGQNRVTAGFKAPTYPSHIGIDFGASIGTSVYSCGAGNVLKVSNSSGAGNYVIVRYKGCDVSGSSYPIDLIARYFHLDSQNVKTGDVVSRGTLIGKSGNTGNSTGAHLHLEFDSKDQLWALNAAEQTKMIDPCRILHKKSDQSVAGTVNGTTVVAKDLVFRTL